MNVVYTDRSLADIDLAMEWYEGQRKGLGQHFMDCLTSQQEAKKIVVCSRFSEEPKIIWEILR